MDTAITNYQLSRSFLKEIKTELIFLKIWSLDHWLEGTNKSLLISSSDSQVRFLFDLLSEF
jgi:hypothetical protein